MVLFLQALTELQASMIGLIVLLLMAAGAVLLFVLTALKGNRFEYLEKNVLDTAYGLSLTESGSPIAVGETPSFRPQANNKYSKARPAGRRTPPA